MLFHPLFKNIEKVRKAIAALIKRIANYLNEIWHKLVRNLCVENSPLFSQCLKDGRSEAKRRRR
jgi:abortive infection bacteriophage resistance protein